MVFEDIQAAIAESSIKLVAAIAILLLGLVFGRFLSKLTQKILSEIELDRVLRESNIKIPLEQILSNLIKYIIYVGALIMALNQAGLTTPIFNIILTIIFILIIASVILSVKDFIPNLIAGIRVSRKYNIKEGNKIKVLNIEGTIIETDLVETKIRTKNNDIIFIPNSVLTKEILRKNK